AGRPEPRPTACLSFPVGGSSFILGGAPTAVRALPVAGLVAAFASAVTYAASVVLSHRLARRLPTMTVVAYVWAFPALSCAAGQSVPATLPAPHPADLPPAPIPL